jgi:hypothetical protein
MSKTILNDCMVVVNGVDLSDHARSATIETTRDEVEVTSFGAQSKEYLLGLGDATITVEFLQDFDSGEVDETLWPLSQSDTPFTVAVRPTSGAIAADNPEYSMSAVLTTYNPIAGQVGAESATTVTFRNASQAGITRDVTP